MHGGPTKTNSHVNQDTGYAFEEFSSFRHAENIFQKITENRFNHQVDQFDPINPPRNDLGYTPLQAAIMVGSIQTISEILKIPDINLNETNLFSAENTALLTTRLKRYDILLMLLEKADYLNIDARSMYTVATARNLLHRAIGQSSHRNKDLNEISKILFPSEFPHVIGSGNALTIPPNIMTVPENTASNKGTVHHKKRRANSLPKIKSCHIENSLWNHIAEIIKSNPNAVDALIGGKTPPIFVALRQKSLSIFLSFLKFNPNVNQTNKGNLLIIEAFKKYPPGFTTALMETKKVDLSAIPDETVKSIQAKANEGEAHYFNVLRKINHLAEPSIFQLIQGGIFDPKKHRFNYDESLITKKGNTPLQVAIMSKLTNMTAAVLSIPEVNIHEKNEQTGDNAALTAVKRGYLLHFKLLLEHGAATTIDTPNNNGETARSYVEKKMNHSPKLYKAFSLIMSTIPKNAPLVNIGDEKSATLIETQSPPSSEYNDLSSQSGPRDDVPSFIPSTTAVADFEFDVSQVDKSIEELIKEAEGYSDFEETFTHFNPVLFSEKPTEHPLITQEAGTLEADEPPNQTSKPRNTPLK